MEAERKLFLGGRLKRLRRDLALNQTRMAEGLGVSPSYLNHLERNQRPVTARILLRLAEVYDVDLRSFSGESDAAGEADLQEVFSDALFKGLAIPRHEVLDLAENAPGAAEAITRLYRAYAEGRRRAALAPEPGAAAGLDLSPLSWVRDYVQERRNHFPDLDAAGEALAAELGATGSDFEHAARARLESKHHVRVSIMPVDVMVNWTRRYDLHRRRLLLSEQLGSSSRAIALAYQIVLMEHSELLAGLADGSGAPDIASKRLLKVLLANYLAAAVMMPYSAFHQAAESLNYDVSLLKSRFGAGYEQTCHRLTTLSRPGQRGVPFFLLRVDSAGNVSKRFASIAFPFSRFGGACPRWNIHTVFKTPGRIITQIIETPQGERYFTLSRTVKRTPTGGRGADDGELALGLGCELKHAHRLVYAKGLDLTDPAVTQIGPTCTLCERPICPERAAPPDSGVLVFEEWSRPISPFAFEVHG
jgi:predicted transcriptional regulator/transcriptional regulator with XRE-family HTH domain